MLQKSASSLLVPAVRNALQARFNSVVAGPPQVKVSRAEKAIMGIGMCTALLVYPSYILVNIRRYKGEK